MPRLEMLREADYVLSACGRPVPPSGYRFVDLPRVIPFHFDISAGTPATPFNKSISNNSTTVFLARGVAVAAGFGMRIKWPTGRYLSQLVFQPSDGDSPEITPYGGGGMFCFDEEVELRPDARVTVQLTGPVGVGSSVDAFFWGVLRYLLKENDDALGKAQGAIALMPDPVQVLRELPRYTCTPNQNIMAPEWLLGNQCTPETPEGFEDESFTFFSPAIDIVNDTEVFNVEVMVPGAGVDVIVKKLTFIVTFSAAYTAIPVMQIRLPNGYSLTGGDYIPVLFEGNLPYVSEMPVFPTFRSPAGQRIIIDAADMDPSGVGTTTVIVQFDGCKRRRRGQL